MATSARGRAASSRSCDAVRAIEEIVYELGERAGRVAGDEMQVRVAVIRFFEIDAQHEACKISQSCARIQRRKTFI